MIQDIKPYPAYKDSCVPWLGDVPEHWEKGPGFAAFREKKIKNVGLKEQTVLSLSYGRIVIKPQDKLRGLVPESFETYQIVDPGDIIIRSTDLQNDWTSLRVGLVRNRGIITSAYLCFKTTPKLMPEYGYQMLHAFDLMKIFYGMGSGLRQNLDFSDFKRMVTFIPPKAEQTAIVSFINRADRRIRDHIRTKQKLIKVLNEQKRSIIQHAVTRGINPDVRLKPSGVEWLGDVPEHWGKSRLKFEASHIVDCLHATPEYIDGGPYPAIRTADIEIGKVRLGRTRRVSQEQYLQWTARLVPQEGDILYSREGERYGIAALVPAGVELCISQRMMIFRIKPTQRSDYIMWQLNCPHVYTQAAADIIGATSPHVNVEKIKNFKLVLPPPGEQKQIVDWIASNCESLDKAISFAHREIDIIREYRTRLITDVVTGKLDVRGVAVEAVEEELEDLLDADIEEIDDEMGDDEAAEE